VDISARSVVVDPVLYNQTGKAVEIGLVVGDQGDAEGNGVSGNQLVQRVLVAGSIAKALPFLKSLVLAI
jgi:hypothetical protein